MQNQTAQQVVKALKEANNVLVTVKNNPSVDELTAAVGLTLLLNHMSKHAITVFSGRVPSTIEFLQPESAIDATTDSLRDFIIALDKSKADKLRYKVEDNVVRIFITPYKTSISEKDLEFSQGDFNVDVVVALGVVSKEDFDQAITTHGRILHDATVVTVTKQGSLSQMGAINWQEQRASSISEMIASIVDDLGQNLLDGQIATAFMTGIVSETDRFKNNFTTPQVLSISSKLLTAGANQQLIAEKLEEPDVSNMAQPLAGESSGDGSLEINHDEDVKGIEIDDHGNFQVQENASLPPVSEEPEIPEVPEEPTSERTYVSSVEPPQLYAEDDSGQEKPQALLEEQPDTGLHTDVPPHPATDLAAPSEETNHRKTLYPVPPEDEVASAPQPVFQEAPPLIPAKPSSLPPEPAPPVAEGDSAGQPQTLSDLEKAVDSPHVQAETADSQAVDEFLGTSRPVGDPPESTETDDVSTPAETPAAAEEQKKDEETTASSPPAQMISPSAPPPGPPPLMPPPPNQPQFFDADGNSSNPFLNPS